MIKNRKKLNELTKTVRITPAKINTLRFVSTDLVVIITWHGLDIEVIEHEPSAYGTRGTGLYQYANGKINLIKKSNSFLKSEKILEIIKEWLAEDPRLPIKAVYIKKSNRLYDMERALRKYQDHCVDLDKFIEENGFVDELECEGQ